MICPKCDRRIKMSSGNRKKHHGIWQHKKCMPWEQRKRELIRVIVRGRKKAFTFHTEDVVDGRGIRKFLRRRVLKNA